MNKLTLLVKRILIKNFTSDKTLGIRAPNKDGDVGYDLVVSEDTVIMPYRYNKAGMAVLVPCAVKIKIPEGYWCQIVGRSSAAKRGILVHTATIDNGYTGPMFACCWNMGDTPVTARRGERLAQVVFHKIYLPEIKEVEELPETERGETGFGSTGGHS